VISFSSRTPCLIWHHTNYIHYHSWRVTTCHSDDSWVHTTWGLPTGT